MAPNAVDFLGTGSSYTYSFNNDAVTIEQPDAPAEITAIEKTVGNHIALKTLPVAELRACDLAGPLMCRADALLSLGR